MSYFWFNIKIIGIFVVYQKNFCCSKEMLVIQNKYCTTWYHLHLSRTLITRSRTELRLCRGLCFLLYVTMEYVIMETCYVFTVSTHMFSVLVCNLFWSSDECVMRWSHTRMLLHNAWSSHRFVGVHYIMSQGWVGIWRVMWAVYVIGTTTYTCRVVVGKVCW